jgi:hypothetical protein
MRCVARACACVREIDLVGCAQENGNKFFAEGDDDDESSEVGAGTLRTRAHSSVTRTPRVVVDDNDDAPDDADDEELSKAKRRKWKIEHVRV